MSRFEIVLGFLITAATACLLMAVIIAAKAQAADLPRGLGHPTGANHWYDSSCCDKKDCEPVEPGAIKEVPGGYYVHYLSSRGIEVRGFIHRGSSGDRSSQDGMEHACAPTNMAICIYLPRTT
jgi:hypothetical protein